MTPLEVGAEAPDFALRDQHGTTVTLSSYRGRAVVLVFYPWAFTRVCEGELRTLQELLPEFQNDTTALLAVSCDPMHSLRAFAEADGLTFPLLSDHWPHGEVSRAFGVFNEATGAANRSTFVLDGTGVVAWAVHNAFPQARDVEDYRKVLRKTAK
ncbi:MAG TPA: peroxiredoxin [Nocardioidaceae bacterium]|nr:peroxiredoxin [Nocardioidaceae bacterium]